MSLEDEQGTVGTQYYGTDINDLSNYGYGSSGYGFDDVSNYDFGSSGYGFDDTAVDWSGYGNLTPAELGKLGTITDSNSLNAIANAAKNTLGDRAGAFLKKYLFDPKTGEVNLAGLGAAGMALYGLMNQDKQGGYNKPVPKMDMVRDQVQYNDPNRRPGEGGRQYFTDPRFATQGDAESIAAAKAASAEQGQGILAAYQPRPAQASNPYAGKMNLAYAQQQQTGTPRPSQNPIGDSLKSALAGIGGPKDTSGAMPATSFSPVPAQPSAMPKSGGLMAAMGNYQMPALTPEIISLMQMSNAKQTPRGAPSPYDAPENVPASPSDGLYQSYAEGGIADTGRYLQGKTDGMADEIPSSIDGEQPAALSHGEFVIPADVVSHLGNGNSDAGAQKLYEMMDRIRMARTGTKEQGKEINPDEFTMGGLTAAYAGGGTVKGFNGVTGSDVNATGGNGATGATGSSGIPNDISRTSTLSPWVGDYVTNALGQGAALAAAPYQAYTGPLTAGASNLQQQAFAGASEMAMAGYNPAQFTGGFNAQTAQQYMNPYLQASLDPQLKELNRQSQIARLEDSGRLTKAGAYGGSRQAIMESEGRRNLLDKQQDLLASGYKSAYDAGLGQFNKEREADEASRQFGANFGLKSIDQLSGLGAVERGITSEGIAADKAQFEEQRDFAYGMPKYQLGLLSGLPIGANTTSVDQDALGKLQTQLAGLSTNYTLLDKALKDLGVTK
jgi:hypothetical protein